MPADAVVEHLAPDEVAVALDDRVRAAELVRLLREERRVDAAVTRPSRPRSRAELADLVAAQRVARVDADADDVAGAMIDGIERLERLVGDDRIAESRGRRPASTYSQRGVMTPMPNDT